MGNKTQIAGTRAKGTVHILLTNTCNFHHATFSIPEKWEVEIPLCFVLTPIFISSYKFLFVNEWIHSTAPEIIISPDRYCM